MPLIKIRMIWFYIAAGNLALLRMTFIEHSSNCIAPVHSSHCLEMLDRNMTMSPTCLARLSELLFATDSWVDWRRPYGDIVVFGHWTILGIRSLAVAGPNN